MLDPEDLRPIIKKLFETWKIHVFYRRMTLKEYEARRSGMNDLMRSIGEPAVQPTSWVLLRKTLRTKDPDLSIPEEIRPLVYR